MNNAFLDTRVLPLVTESLNIMVYCVFSVKIKTKCRLDTKPKTLFIANVLSIYVFDVANILFFFRLAKLEFCL